MITNINTSPKVSVPSNYTFIKPISDKETQVYLVFSKEQNTRQVFKVFPASDPKKVERFFTEVAVGKELDNPNILCQINNGTYTDPMSGESYHFVTSPYCPNGDLLHFFKKVNEQGQLDEKYARTFFRQAVEGLVHLHSKGKAHMDLKLGNFLIGNDYRLKIFDFDLSYCQKNCDKIVGRGTKGFRAPELAKGKLDIDPFKCDIYSLGILLFFLVTGFLLPFDEDDKGNFSSLRSLFDLRESSFFVEFGRKWNNLKFSKEFKTLFSGLVQADPKKRISLEDVKKSEWYNKEFFSDEELAEKMEKISELFE